MIEGVFWGSILLVAISWLVYPVVMFFISKLDWRCDVEEIIEEYTPTVSVVLAVYNGVDKIEKKIVDILALDYPKSALDIIVVSDGSTDGSDEEIKRLEKKIDIVTGVYLDANNGKSCAQNVGVSSSAGEYILFTDIDANMSRDSLKKMIRKFLDKSVGCVGSNVKYAASEWEVSGSQGIYWKMEEITKLAESKIGVLISVVGSAIIVKREYFVPLDDDTGDDFIIPLNLALIGKRTVIEKNAIVFDKWPAKGFLSELKVRRRITLRNFLGLIRRVRILNPLNYPMLSISIISHKLLRWLTPVFMIVSLLASYHLSVSWFYNILFQLQVIGYIVCTLGLVANYKKIKLPIIGALGNFLWTNVGVFMGLISLVLGARIHSYKNV